MMTESSRRRPWRARVRALPGIAKVWLLVAATIPVTVAVAVAAGQIPAPDPAFDIPWPAMAVMFLAAEAAVVHYQFRQDAHSFSMSEVPLIIGLYFMEPVPLILAQLLGTFVVLAVHRRLPAVKVAFNLTQFALQTASAALAFRLLVSTGDPFGPLGWVGGLVAGFMALLVADLLINSAIRLSGGRLARSQMIEVLLLSGLAATMNVTLGLVAVTILASAPSSSWLALAPSIVLFVAYRAYMGQRVEGGRLQSLYEATRVLHRSPQIESALLASAQQAVAMFEIEFAEIYVFPRVGAEKSFVTAVGPGTREVVMRPCDIDLEDGSWPTLLADGRAILIPANADFALPRPHSDQYPAREAIVAPLTGPDGPIGAFLIANRLGDVSSLGSEDQRLLEALASQVGVSLENGRLEDSLAQLTELKDQLEALVVSKDRFVATVSHELRTPLTAIYGLSHELHSNRPAITSAELDEFIGVIAAQSAELSDLIEDLLVAARADTDALRVHAERCDLRREIATTLEAHPEAVVVRSGDGAPSHAHADPLRFRQILRNLLTNARRYGGERVWVEIQGERDRVLVTVVDDGEGVPASMSDAIFDPYESAHDPGTQPASVGLGLAVSRRLARLMGGDLVYRRHDGTTRFELTLPGAR